MTNLVASRDDIFVWFIKADFECGSYFAFCENDPVLKLNDIVRDAREHYCEHNLMNTTCVEFPKKYLADLKDKLESLYVMYCGCCAFGA